MTDKPKRRKSSNSQDDVDYAIQELAGAIVTSSDSLGGAVAGVVIGGTLYAGYHAAKFVVENADNLDAPLAEVRKQAKRATAGAAEVTRQVASGADLVTKPAETIVKSASRARKQAERAASSAAEVTKQAAVSAGLLTEPDRDATRGRRPGEDASRTPREEAPPSTEEEEDQLEESPQL